MLDRIIHWSIANKLIVFIFIAAWIGFGIFALSNLPIGAVPDVTTNQVQVITTSRNLATEDVEKYLTYPVELEMANLPGVIEIRSISKFGLSVVTIVFEDDMGTYLPRQLIAERIKMAEESIPTGFGTPIMGPISTGLGEIYQYIIDVKPGYESDYSITDLRSIQDWVVRRQLSGIEGVVEVNTWGGFLKQYEVAINPERLKGMQIDIAAVFHALESNNSIAGGGYIEKTNESFFIRGEGLVASLEDIGNIVVEVRNGSPIYVRDIAEVGFGHANRFGAITANGEGEKVLGQVMMLKGADSKGTIDRVKERLEEIESSLPDGIIINGFLDRSELIERTTFTIAENLILGCLIVVFVVVLLLGNFRSGLVVASVIPLSLLFALSMMYIFGVDANLMSLGAIDFGIIIDGAVIIVEFIAYQFTRSDHQLAGLSKVERQEKKDEISFTGASKMMHSAIFGQIIIIIVFIPILSLTGVEGKMFRPMAEVFSFALIGAMILGLTYVPVVSALFLKTTPPGPKNISTIIINGINKVYQPTITWALDHTKVVLLSAFGLLAGTILIFITMGSEFVPTLDEGDFVIQPFLKTGTSLTNTVETTTRIEKILKEFPEVNQIVTRIGAAEIPTDPMSMEESDVIVTLKPRSEWTTVNTKDELAEKFKEALEVIPGMEYEFTQPIEMRFNELITGVRADLAIKVFGEDLDVLLKTAEEIEAAIQGVEGAADIILEKVDGLPQMKIEYDRGKIAKFGLNISDLNEIVSMGFAGMSAGKVFEGERQFDLVVRFAEPFRKDIQNLEQASIQLPNGGSVPLSELATISYTKGPAKISRDNTNRRIVIGVNVRNRDLQSVVDDIQAIVANQINFPEGYRVEYGGQFENLQQARNRLMIAVPIALFLIFVLLYFAFSSAKDALMIYSAIPLSAIGGVLLLWARDMPFSISAGVGFIALFGIAVLNGIVLIEHFKSMETHYSNLKDLVIKGAMERLRPVLLTASAAALGFLPMAISNSAGAEVQRPLATVVVGGLISATILTLIVLPVLYVLFKKKAGSSTSSAKKVLASLVLIATVSFGATAQETPLTLAQAMEIGVERNLTLQAASKSLDMANANIGQGWNLEKTNIYYAEDKNDIAENGIYNRKWGLSQNFSFPTLYGAQKNALEAGAEMQLSQFELQQRKLEGEISKAFIAVRYWDELIENYDYLDSLYSEFTRAASRKFETGETNYLEKLTAEGKRQEISLKKSEANENYLIALDQLKLKLNWEGDLTLAKEEIDLDVLLEEDLSSHPGVEYYESAVNQSGYQIQTEKRKLLPDFNIEVFRGTNQGADAKVYPGFQAGISLPLFFGAQKASVKSSEFHQQKIQLEAEQYQNQLSSRAQQLQRQLDQNFRVITYYESEGKTLSLQILEQAQRSYQEGEIDFLQYVQLLDNSRTITLQYLQSKFAYQQTILDINFLLN
ncbi:cobalt-zinc-cadmium resistance protein CzcA [Algoriphagus ratkowskyi]|uniref:Cobalt-zinc-cadmium resistance protein CzcA n=1 Tax=Algoriphagus ratkowskyi TaxID=57028 RepID=A0A2W7RMW3_9BACT|nr:CusA/CzcA family heavy metal efflux RND transporter [Algoriphagus ratkowskyi]PZX55889.1 cobalt-zinc-cadmium resistance protein CzcA [Algoriphagus ratkowskyi]TXD77291.1 CusA/CzcA family heavy metal efflux RND transporter [Algoriphagus ratkowskyi]